MARGEERERIEAWLTRELSERVEFPLSEIRVDEPFEYYGLESVEGIRLAADLGAWLSRSLPETLVFDHPTIADVAAFLTADGNGRASPSTAPVGGRLPARPQDAPEPIAIVGAACRFPGAASKDAFWDLLCDGEEAIVEVPPDRWPWQEHYDADFMVEGKMNVRHGGFIEDVDQFDARFFGISPFEAARMDPQQRVLLEVGWEAFEDAGIALDRVLGRDVGVFVGVATSDYTDLQLQYAEGAGPYSSTGGAASIVANRLSYTWDLRGPSIAVDTACSSSLTAVHLACQAIRTGDATMALAGGVNVMLEPAITISLAKLGVLSPDGCCRAFDARANGMVRSEGVGAVILKPLADALADRDVVYATIHGSAVNSDGRSNGLTSPNRAAQERVLRRAYQRAGVTPSEVQYVEAHGTGTLLGDPIEADALGDVLGKPCTSGQIAVGSVKTNIGHLEAAAGIAGLIKAALAIRHRALPASLNFEIPNPHIRFDDLNLAVQDSFGQWPRPSEPLVAGVSSFGFGGTNAHVVLSEAGMSG